MAVNLVRKSKNEDEEERRKQLLAQMQQNSQARKDAEIQSVKDMKLNWVDPTAKGFKGAANRTGWIFSNAGAGAKKSVLDTLSAPMQSTAVGLQRGANQAAQENSTWDKIKNYGKNTLKSISYSAGGPVGVLLYNATIGRKDLVNDYLGTATKIVQNYEQAKSGFGKAGAIIGGVSSKVIQDNNSLLQNIYNSSQQVGQIIGEEKANKATEKVLEADTKLHEKNDKRLEELQRQGTLYGGVTRKLGETGQTIGYMTPSIAIGLATGGAGETVGLVQMGLAAKGSTTREAMQQGADLETAERKGVASGTAEAASEKMFGGLKAFKPFKESGVEDVAKKYIAETIEKRISSQLGQTVAKTAGNWLVDVTGETIEELTTDIYNTWLDQATTDPNAQYTLDDAINTAVGTALSTTVLNVGYAGLNKGIQKVYDRNQARANNQESIPEAERIESNGYKENLQEMLNNLDIPEEVKAQIQPMLDSNATINAEEYKDITNNIKTLVKANTQQQIQDYGAELTTQYNAIEEQRQSLDNIKPEYFKDQEVRRFYAQQLNKEFSDSTIDNILTMYPENRNGNRTVKQYKEIAKEYGKQMALNGLTFDEVRANTVGAWQYYEPNKNITQYDNQQKKNVSFDRLNSQVWSEEVYNSYRDTMKAQLDQQQKDLADTANARLEEIQDEENILIDTIDNLKPRATAEQVAKTKKLVEDFAKARGVNVEYNAEVFKNSNEEAFIKDNGNGERTIYINPNADPDTILVKLATHEMFHDTIRTQPHDKLTKLVMDKLQEDENYNMYRQSVIDAYQEQLEGKTQAEQDALIDEEMTAKYLGEYLGDEQFVQQLVNSTNRSTIQRIVDWIDNRLEQLKNIVTGNREAEYWRKVRENFVKAYNEEYVSEEGQYYSRVLADGNEQLGIEGFNNVQNGQLTIDGLEQQNNEQNFEQESIDDLQQTNTEQVNEQTEEKPIEQPKVPTRERIQKTTTRIEDFGEKIGMARKDLAMERGTRRNPNKEVTHEYTVMSSEEFNDRMSKSPIVFMGERQQINGYGVFFKGKLLTDGFNTPQQAEEFISTFKENLKSNMAYVESGTTRDGTENYLVYLRNPRNLRDRLYSGKSFTNKQEAESYAMALSIYLKDHGKNLFRPQIQKIERVNPNVKNATKTTGDNILNDFGFRGGEFGNWVTNTERQEFLNYAEDGLTDLAEALGVEKDSLGQNGQMAIAFGARGKGLTGAVAHFEPERKVINMTRLKGAGSLAHEYGHSIDNYLSRINGYNENGLATETNDVYLRKLPENVKKAIDNVVDKLKYSTSTNQEDIDKKNNLYEKRRIESLEYNLNDMDRIFAGKSTTYKKIKGKYEVVPIEVTEKQAKQYQKIRETLMKGEVTGSTTFEDVKDRYGIRTEVRYPEPISTLQSLYKEVVGRKLNDDTVRSLYMRGKPVQQVREVKSESAYSKSARELDKLMGRSTLYHATTPEMWARAFEAYVYDKLKAKGITDNYLVSSVNNEDYALFNPFPGGEERANINQAFDELLDVMKQEGYFKGKEDVKYSKKTTFDDYLKEQSKIKDEKGNLLNVYHTTNADFDTFDRSKIGSTTDEGIWGKGFYFSNKPADYGSNKITANLYISNPFVINDFKTPSEMADFLDMSESNFYKDNSIGAIRPNYSQINQFTAHLMERGYDGVVVKHDNGFTEYVAFNPEQINIVNKENTDVNKNNNKDNQGRTLTKEQQEYFKDSKVRDENGNLVAVYHGTPNGDFNIFDKNRIGSTTDEYGRGDFGSGFYFTAFKEGAETYATGKNGKVIEAYLDLKNPLRLDYFYETRENINQYMQDNKKNILSMTEQDFQNVFNESPLTQEEYEKISDEVDKFEDDYSFDNLEDLENMGYDGVISPNMEQIVALRPEQIKRIDNKAPTTNPDINYNINSQAYDDYLKANNPNRRGVTIGDLQQKLPVNQPETTQPILPTQQSNIANDYIKFRELTEQVKNGDITEAEFDRLSNLDDIQQELKDLGKTDKQVQDIIFELGNLRDNQLNEQDINNLINLMGMNANDREAARSRIARGELILPTTNVQPTTESLEIPNEQTSLPLGEQVNPSTQKQRQAYKSIIESPYMSEEAKKVARKFIGQDTYTPDSNLKQLERADNIISRLGTEKALNQLESNAMEGRTIKAEDIATGDRLIEYYSKIGDSENLQRAIRATAMAGTQAGRSVQAFALLKHQTPQGMAIWIQNSVDKLNSQMKKGQFDFTPEMQEKILNSTEENLQENANEVMKELGQQVPQDLLGKLDSWRYFSMLANPKTHIRNIVGNFAMGLTQQFKSKVAGTIEQVTRQDRTHTSFLEKRNKADIDFAKNDLKNVAAQLGIGESKYSNPKTQIQQNQRVFKSDALEKTLGRLFNLNDNLLEAEDNFGLKNAYVRNLSDYMTANKLNPNTITNEQLQQARKIAIEEALRATFHQESSLASMLNQIENKNLASRVLMGGLVPFKKTPINVAKSGFEYSPAGLAKAIVYDSVQLRKGNINVNEYIDNISKGLTGTGIALVGYALAEAGILKAAGDDDKEDKYKEAMGEQPYSITINGKSYSLDWLAPTGIPLFVGAELNKLVHDTTEKEGETQNGVLKAIGRVTDATSSLLNPMSEMSMISGLTSTIQSFSSDPGQALMNLVVSPVKSYVGQVVPTAVGQVARTMDKYERDTSSTETGLLPKAIDQTKNQIMNKIPGLRQLLPTKKDIWGNEVETQDYFHNAVLPYTKKEVKTNAVDKELNDLYERTGENIYPNTSLSKTVTYEGSKTRLTNQDYNEFKTNYGKTSYKLLEDLTKSQEYKGMTDAQKVQAIKDVYTYANNLNKTEYAEKKGIEFKTPTDVQQVRAVKAYGGKESDYFKYKGITDGLSKDSEKMVALRDSNLSAKSKRAVYSATLGKDDTFFQSTDINVDEYLGYKTANIQGTKDSNGKTISGSKKAAQLDYINNNISGYENRLLLMGKDYKLSRSQQQDLAEYIYTLDNADDLFAMYDKNFTVRDGTVYYK